MRGKRWTLGLMVAMTAALMAGCDEPKGELGEEPSGLATEASPLIGTGGSGWDVGTCYPGATAPFGMIQPSPDTTRLFMPATFDHSGGYHADDNIIIGFSHMHLSGVGIPALGGIMLMPVTGPLGASKITPEGYRSLFRDSTEEAQPGYYAVTLDRTGIRAELTATIRAAHHRYTYPDVPGGVPAPEVVILDLGHAVLGSHVAEGEFDVKDDFRTVEGWLRDDGGFTGRFGGLKAWFILRFREPFSTYSTFKDGVLEEEVPHQEGLKTGAAFTFDLATGHTVEAQIALSFVSLENARANLDAEMPAWDFDGTRKAALQAWNNEFSVFKITGGTPDQRKMFASALYHAFLMPTTFNDANGEYHGFDKEVHRADGFTYYTNFSLWDTYRTVHPLLILVRPERQRDMLHSLLAMADQGGYLPKWPMGYGYTNCMVGTSADIVVAESYLKGITDFDIVTAYDKIMSTAYRGTSGHAYSGRPGIEDFLQYGYIPADHRGGSVSVTQEYCVADAAISNLAAALGKTSDAEDFRQRSYAYQNLWDANVQFLRGRNADGTWMPRFDANLWLDYYVEGNAWQYLWLEPHDPEGLIGLFGSKEAMIEKLETLFENSAIEAQERQGKDRFWRWVHPTRWYWQGNEPDIHAAYLFNDAGRPDLAQKWVRWIASTLYTPNADGLPGNDDGGTLSAWYVLTAMGIYPMNGSAKYWLGSPMFPKMEVKLKDGTLVIEAPNASETNIYVRSVTLNGRQLTEPWLDHADIAAGGTLHFDMAATP